jgi:acylphosphatase
MRYRVTVRGRVQGVGYRYACARRAHELGVVGWVRNRHDGAVETEIQAGDDATAAMLDWLRRGPPGAHVDAVDAVEIADEAGEAGDGFAIRP